MGVRQQIANQSSPIHPPQHRGINKLTDAKCRSFASHRGTDQKKKLFDGAGLYLTHTRAGLPVWRIKYRYGRVERTYTIGAYPGVSLESARAERDTVRAQLREGVDPVQARQIRRVERVTASAETFEALSTQWFEKNKRYWSPIHYEKAKQAFERDVFPIIGRLPVADIAPAAVSQVVTKILARGVAETASKILQHIVGVFRLGQALGLRQDNPATPVRELIPKKRKVTPRPALLDIEALREVLRRADLQPISPVVRLANRLCAFSACRLGNVVEAEWSEFDLDSNVPTWTIPRAKMKAKDRQHDHVVYLGSTIAAELRAWRDRTEGKGYVFPSPSGKRAYVGRETIEKLYADALELAGKMSLHGWRAAFSTLARDAGWARDVVELSLDHIHDSATVRAYDRGERKTERIKLAQWWDAQLNPPPAGVVPIATAKPA
jgi:integrase